ncbi:hypothetical protein [Cerasicoccus maritimus]|uniref:hypothetical protein n=1 Tax=Cerasicoccus maritimus TaxID=490089 RepID=UPI0028526AB6|nr:hypothetical protein [Cerasicoccus maritimus]
MVTHSYTKAAIAVRRIAQTDAPNPDDTGMIMQVLFGNLHEFQLDALENLTRFFWSQAQSPQWLTSLPIECYKCPDVQTTSSGYSFPRWPAELYLSRMLEQETTKVAKILSQLDTNNVFYYDLLCKAAALCDLERNPWIIKNIIKYINSEYKLSRSEIPTLLEKLSDIEPLALGIEILDSALEFLPDPEAESKIELLRKGSEESRYISLKPKPKFDRYEYDEILNQGVRGFVAKDAYAVSILLIEHVNKMLDLGSYQDDPDERHGEDFSEIWCRRLDRPDNSLDEPKETLVHSLTMACEKAYERCPDHIKELDRALREPKWHVFKRLRQHLYAKFPSETNKPWIEDLVREHEDYDKWDYHYEFQVMLRTACTHFDKFLDTATLRAIFEQIKSGPNQQRFKEWLGDNYSDEGWEKRKAYFHRSQLRPFESKLFGDYKAYYETLCAEAKSEITDENYSPVGETRGGTVSHRSPYSQEALAKLDDEELLKLINEWDESHRDEKDWLIEIDVSSLAGAFAKLFRSEIITKEDRFNFWLSNRDNIERPAYIIALVRMMNDLIKEGDYRHLEIWINFCDWVLDKPNEPRNSDDQRHPESREFPDWPSTRRSVSDLLDTCVEKDSAVDVRYRKGIFGLLKKLCIQPDWWLESDQNSTSSRVNYAINHTRSRALETLIDYGFWVRLNVNNDEPIPEVAALIEARLNHADTPPLTLAEHALLGLQYLRLFQLDKAWTIKNTHKIFPQTNLKAWAESFGSYLQYNSPYTDLFPVLKGELEFAVTHLPALEEMRAVGEEIPDRLAQHLFNYYLWELVELNDGENLLAKFYNNTNSKRSRWATLFNHVGHTLWRSRPDLEDSLIQRVKDYFEWRYSKQEALEVNEFTFWLRAECLDVSWRLETFSRVLTLCHNQRRKMKFEFEELSQFVPEHTPMAIECFRKICKSLSLDQHFYVAVEDSRKILSYGLNSDDPEVKAKAEAAQELLLMAGRFELLDIPKPK